MTQNTPLAMMFSAIIARDEADRTIEFAALSARAGWAPYLKHVARGKLTARTEPCDAVDKIGGQS